MDFCILLVFVFGAPAAAIYGGQVLDERIWNANYSREKTKRLAGLSWLGMSLLPFTTGTLILVFIWLPTLKKMDFVTQIVFFMFGGLHLILGMVFIVAGLHYFFKR